MGEINFTNGIIMGVVFALCIILFAINFAGDNGSDINAGSDAEYAQYQIDQQAGLNSFTDSIDSADNSFQEDNVKEGTDTATSGGQFKVVKKPSKQMAINTATVGFKKIFGEDSGFGFILTTLITVLAFMLLRYAYKTWFGKDPD